MSWFTGIGRRTSASNLPEVDESSNLSPASSSDSAGMEGKLLSKEEDIRRLLQDARDGNDDGTSEKILKAMFDAKAVERVRRKMQQEEAGQPKHQQESPTGRSSSGQQPAGDVEEFTRKKVNKKEALLIEEVNDWKQKAKLLEQTLKIVEEEKKQLAKEKLSLSVEHTKTNQELTKVKEALISLKDALLSVKSQKNALTTQVQKLKDSLKEKTKMLENTEMRLQAVEVDNNFLENQLENRTKNKKPFWQCL